MLKKLCLLLALVALVHCQTNLPYETYLSPSYRLSWGVSNDSITIQLDVKTTGWVALSLLSDDGNLLDVWWGGYDEDYGLPYIQVVLRLAGRGFIANGGQWIGFAQPAPSINSC